MGANVDQRQAPAGHGRPQHAGPSRVARAPDRAGLVMALQRSAGNRAVIGLLGTGLTPGTSVQRCGPTPCDCGPEERAEKEAQTPGAQPVAQRKTSPDWAIKGKFPGASTLPDTLFFDKDERAPDATEAAKIGPLATPPTRPLIIKGTASEEGDTGLNAKLVDTRIKAVSEALGKAGHSGPRTIEAKPLAGAGNIDYRRARAVEVRVAGTTSATADCSLGPQPNDGGPAPNPFTTALTRAHEMIAKAKTALGTPDAATLDLLVKLFGSAGVASTVASNLGLIDVQLNQMVPFNGSSGHRVVNNCDASCGGGASAYNNGDGPGALMTLCPDFMATPSLDLRAAMLIHEGSHGTPGLNTNDQAYVWQRLITQLPPTLALANADSYTAFARLAAAPGSIDLGPTTKDIHAGGMTPDEEKAADRSLAWVEQWLVGTTSEISSLYGVAHASQAKKAWTNTYYQATMDLVAKRLGLTAPPKIPKQTDKVALAGINDRYQTLADAIGGQVTLEKVPGKASTWPAGPAAKVSLGSDFFKLGAKEQAALMLTKLVAALSTISKARRAGYVNLVHDVVKHGDFGTP